MHDFDGFKTPNNMIFKCDNGKWNLDRRGSIIISAFRSQAQPKWHCIVYT